MSHRFAVPFEQVEQIKSGLQPCFPDVPFFPRELIFHILSFLDWPTWLIAQQVSHMWLILAGDTLLWKKACAEAWGLKPHQLLVGSSARHHSWKDIFRTLVRPPTVQSSRI
mmetsp:Transcript_24903/g.62530  ORF Transcript_24903/g.62530 Transcript_24903/m.62530 type:complete len:111 (+) Transcript_24903:73-405(+)